MRDFPTDASRHSSLNSVSNLSAARWALVPGTGRLARCMANYSSGNVAACAIRVAIGGQVPHFAVRFRWHAPGVVNKSLGAVVPTRTPFTWPASTYSRTSSARPWIDLTTTERLNYRHLCPDVLRKGWGQSPTIVRRIGAPASRDARHREQAHQCGTHSHTERSDHVPFNIVAQEQRWSEQLTVYSRSWPEVAGEERHVRHPRPRWPAAVSPLSILLFLEVLDAVLICMAPVSRPASGHPAGLVRGPQPPAVAAGASIPPFQGAFRCLG